MRISSYAVARPAYYDRNATAYAQAYDLSLVAPHVLTIRFTTTVAAGKKLLLEHLSSTMIRQSVAAPVGDVYIAPSVTTGASTYPITRTYSNANVAGTTTYSQVVSGVTLYPSDVFTVSTFDGSTGGTMWYTIGAKGTTYDA